MDRKSSKRDDRPYQLIVEAGPEFIPRVPPSGGVGIIKDDCQPILRFHDSDTIEFNAWGCDPANITARVIPQPVIPIPPPPTPPVQTVTVGPSSFIRMGRNAEPLTFGVVVGTGAIDVPYGVVNLNSDPAVFNPSGGSTSVLEAGSYQVGIRLPFTLIADLASSTELRVTVNGTVTGLVDTVPAVVGLANTVTHYLEQPLILAAGDVVGANLLVTGVAVGAITLGPSEGYMTITRIQNVTVV